MKMKYKFLMFVLLLIPLVAAEKTPDSLVIKGFINDYAEIIPVEYEVDIINILTELYDSDTAEMAIVTVESLDGKDIGSYSLDLAQGVLGDQETNNGLLLLVTMEEREYRFEVGRGLEYILNDAKIGRIGRTYLKPNFANEEYGKGVYEASMAVRSILLEDNESEYYIDDSEVDPAQVAQVKYSLSIFLIIFIILIIISVFSKGDDGGFFAAALMAGALFGGVGGGGSGGFGGFGGGGFGGGGASGGF